MSTTFIVITDQEEANKSVELQFCIYDAKGLFLSIL